MTGLENTGNVANRKFTQNLKLWNFLLCVDPLYMNTPLTKIASLLGLITCGGIVFSPLSAQVSTNTVTNASGTITLAAAGVNSTLNPLESTSIPGSTNFSGAVSEIFGTNTYTSSYVESASVTLGSDPVLTASASMDGSLLYNSFFTASSVATLFYYVEISGPVASNVMVPIDFSSSSSTLSSGTNYANGSATASLLVSASSGTFTYTTDSVSGSITTNFFPPTTFLSLSSQSPSNNGLPLPGGLTNPPVPSSYSTNGVFMVPSGITLAINMRASASASTTGSVTNSAMIDPVFGIDPSFTATNSNYSLTFSPNLAVPEPSPLSLYIFGISTLGLVILRRRVC